MTVEKNELQRFRKKPVVIEAIRWSGMDGDDLHAVLDFIQDGHGNFEHLPKAPDDPHVYNGIGFTPSDGRLYIPTLEGTHAADPGDYITRGVKGEFYPCKPDIFAATYEPVAEPTPNAYEDCMKIHVNEVCLDSFEGFCGCFEHGWNTGLCSSAAEIDALKAERDQLRAGLRCEIERMEIEINALRAERDEFKQRWITAMDALTASGVDTGTDTNVLLQKLRERLAEAERNIEELTIEERERTEQYRSVQAYAAELQSRLDRIVENLVELNQQTYGYCANCREISAEIKRIATGETS